MKKLILILALVFSATFLGYSQCNNGTNYYPTTNYDPTDGTWGYASTCNYAGEVLKVNVISGDQYQFSTCGDYGGVTASYDTQLTLRNESGTVVAFNDDYSGCSGYTSYIDWTADYTGVLYVHLNQYNCATNTTCTRIMILRTAAPSGGGSNSTQVGNPSSTLSNGRVPTYGYYDYSWSAALYTTTDLGPTSIIIDKISYDVYNNVSSTLTNQKIYMAYTDDATFTSTSAPQSGNSNLDGWTQVYSGTVNWQQGWNEITLDQHFYYDGNRNILIKWENDDGVWESNYPRFRYTSTTNTVVYNYNDGASPSSTGYVNSYRPNMIFNHGGGTLPIDLISFTGEVIGSGVELNWVVASQVNNDYYEIQRSIDVENWETISTIPGAGNNNTQMDYKIIDPNPLIGISYYRLKQTDYDGQSEAFHPISIVIKEERKEIVKKLNTLGQEVNDSYLGIVIQIWDNGDITKTMRR